MRIKHRKRLFYPLQTISIQYLKNLKPVIMRSKSNSFGALHPILFFVVMYVVVLFMSIFICSSLFYSFNEGSSSSEASAQVSQKQSFGMPVSAAVVVR